MARIIDRAHHPFWGAIQRRAGFRGWDLEITDEWPEVGPVEIRVSFENPDDVVVQVNFQTIREDWDSIWPRIISRIETMKADYGRSGASILADDWVSLTLPKQPFEEEPEWSVMLQASEAGWLIDFKGWKDFGGQGVF